jgi:hypothetical protein
LSRDRLFGQDLLDCLWLNDGWRFILLRQRALWILLLNIDRLLDKFPMFLSWVMLSSVALSDSRTRLVRRRVLKGLGV